MEKDYQTRLAERNARIEARHAEAGKLEPVKWQVLKDAQPLPVGAERSAAVDRYLQIVEQQHQLKPDPAHLHNRRMEQRQETRDVTREKLAGKDWSRSAEQSRPLDIKPLPQQSRDRDRDR